MINIVTVYICISLPIPKKHCNSLFQTKETYRKYGRSLQHLISAIPFLKLQRPTALISFPKGRIFSSSSTPIYRKKTSYINIPVNLIYQR
jgi:hypothetical protein